MWTLTIRLHNRGGKCVLFVEDLYFYLELYAGLRLGL